MSVDIWLDVYQLLFFKQKTAYEMRSSDWSSDVCSSDRQILPHVVGKIKPLLDRHTSWPVLAEHCELLVSFGGMPVKNSQVTSGGVGRHTVYHGLKACADNGCAIVYLSSSRIDMPPGLGAEWIPVRPGADAALMLALAHTLIVEGLHDRGSIGREKV